MLCAVRRLCLPLLLAASCDAPGPSASQSGPAAPSTSAPTSAATSAATTAPDTSRRTVDTSEEVDGDTVPAVAPHPVRPHVAGDPSSRKAELLRNLGAASRVPLIVGVRVPWRPEGELDAAGVVAQRAGLVAAKLALQRRLDGTGTVAKAAWPSLPFVPLSTTRAGLDRLLADPEVTSVVPDAVLHATLDESVPLIGGDVAWDSGLTGSGQAVAILDTGVDKAHPALAGRVVAEACFSTSDPARQVTTLCPGAATSTTAVGSGVNCSLTIEEGCFHGTHVAGIAAGLDTTFSGVAKGADIVAVQIFSRFDNATSCGGIAPCVLTYTSDQISGLQHVLTLVQGGTSIAAVNMSIGGDSYGYACDSVSPAIYAAFENLRSVGTATVISSGNDAFDDAISSPSCNSNAISVGATTKADVVDTSYSNSASILRLLAPGTDITSASATTTGWISATGTSMAAPHVTGAWALLKQRRPTLGVAEALSILQTTGVVLVDSRNQIGVSRVQVDDALAAIPVEPAVFSPPAGEYASPQTVAISTAQAAATLRYTTDGTTPSAAVGTVIASGGTIAIDAATTLQAVASQSGWPDSVVTLGDYTFPAYIRATLDPAGAIALGAKWRRTIARETFEGPGGFGRFPWKHGGTGTWTISGTGFHGGHLGAQAPDLDDDENSTLSITIDTDGGDVTFWLKVDSEDIYDYLTFQVDGDEKQWWSGEVGWTPFTYTLSAGTHKLLWGYVKDNLGTAGADTAWIDDITFPGDAWRDSGATTRGITDPTTTITFQDIGGAWITPIDQVVATPELAAATPLGVYVQRQVEAPTVSLAPGTFTTAQSITLSTTTPGAAIHVTTDGSTPTAASPTYAGPITAPLATTTSVRAIATLDGWLDSPVTIADYVVTGTVATPTASPTPGTSTTAHTVTLTVTTPSATIRYTTDGTAPTEASTAYTAPIAVGLDSTLTLRAIAFAKDWTPSAELSGTWVVTGTVATPSFSPSPGLFTDAQSLTLSTATSGAAIRYTTDGSAPTAASSLYTTPITLPLGTTTRVRAIATKADWTDAAAIDGTFRVTGTVEAPTLSLTPGTYPTAQTVTLATTTPGATIHVTTDGSTPTSASPAYAGPIALGLDSTTTVRALAVLTDWADSPVTTGAFVITGTVANPTISPAPGTYTTAQSVSLSTTTADATIRFTTDGSTPTVSSPIYTTPVDVGLDSALTIKAAAYRAGWLSSGIVTGTVVVTGTVDAPTFDLEPGVYTSARVVSLSTTTAGATIRYTTDGAEPTEASPVYGAPIALPLATTTRVRARAFQAGWADSDELDGTFRVTGTVATPALSTAPGTYRTAQSISLTTTTDGATIRYTTDGSTPTGASLAYSAPIDVGLDSRVTIRAAAFLADWIDSGVVTGEFVVTGKVAAPTFSPAPGTFTTAQAITLSTTTDGATIHVTTDGSAVTAAAPVYTGPIAVALDSAITVRALAVKGDWDDSDATSATFVVTGTVATPTFDLPPGVYTTAQLVTLSTTTDAATIRYTTDGTAPTEASPVYSAAIAVPLDTTTRIRARAFAPDWVDSGELDGTFRVTGTVVAPVFSVAPGTYTTAQAIALSTTTPGATVRYTTDGSDPTVDAAAFTAPIVVALDSTVTIRAAAFLADWVPSDVATAAYVVTGTVATPTITPDAGVYVSPPMVTLATTTPGATVRYTLDGSDPTAASAAYAAPFEVATTATVRARAFRDGWTDSELATAAYTITGVVADPLFSLPPGTYDAAQSLDASTTTPGATVRYTTDGSDPTEASPALGRSIVLALGTTTTVRARAFLTDWTPSAIVEGTWVVVPPLALAWQGVAPAGGHVDAGTTAALVVQGGVGPFTIDAVEEHPDAVVSLVDRDVTVDVPGTGGFAGTYTVDVTDAGTGWTTSTTFSVPPVVVVSPSALDGAGTATITVTGGVSGVPVPLEVIGLDGTVDAVGALGQAPVAITPVDDDASGNPATGTLLAADVATWTALRVRATIDGVEGTSDVVSVMPRGATVDTDAPVDTDRPVDSDVPDSDVPQESDRPSLGDTDVAHTGSDQTGPRHCGCAQTGAPWLPGAALLLVASLTRRRRAILPSSSPRL